MVTPEALGDRAGLCYGSTSQEGQSARAEAMAHLCQPRRHGHLGGAADVPVVGDWDGDGQDEIGVYQDGAVVKR